MSRSHRPQSEIRDAIVAEARSWVKTPFHHMGRLKGVAVDCAMLLAEVYHSVGLIPDLEIQPYPHDWHVHRGEERYLSQILEFGKETETPEAGDLAIWRFGRCFSHAGIVVQWPRLVHAVVGLYVTEEDVNLCPFLRAKTGELRPRKFYTYLDW